MSRADRKKRHSPNRFTSWEIRPVYNIEVCPFKSTSNCPPDGTSMWIPFGSVRMSTERVARVFERESI